MNPAAAAWRRRGRHHDLGGHRIFTVDLPCSGRETRPPLLVLHGFPTSSFDFHLVADRLTADRRVVLFDMLGYGLSDKPDRDYTFPLQADLAVALADTLGLDRLGLLTHDVGDTLGGELLARQLEGGWDVEITDRAMANGSIYHRLARLSAGQEFLLGLPDERLSAAERPGRDAVIAGVAGTFGPDTAVDDGELAGQWDMIAHLDGDLLLPRLIRYIEERRSAEDRFTGAIERHPSPLTVVWGEDDPIAVADMVDVLCEGRPAIRRRLLAGVGHYPMVEAPERFLEALGVGPPDGDAG